jgi:hypothetical protein
MVTDAKWQERAVRLLKAELAHADIGYKELSERLGKNGPKISAQSIANKLSRAGFSAAFLLQCLDAIGTKKVDLDRE